MDKLENGSTNLRTKPTARLCFSFVPQPKDKATSPERILVFLSGLDNPKTVWQRLLDQLVEQSRRNGIVLPPMLLYDRFGVGQSDPDPTDAGKRPEEYHDANDAVDDLHELIAQIVEQKLGHNKNPVDNLGIVFCAHSFGVCIARLYAQRFPGTTEGLLLMDSAIANTPAEKFTPNPDDPVEWDEAQKWLPETITADMCRDAIRKTLASPVSGYTMTTRERMRWTNMPELLPYSDRPKLQGPRPELPLVTVMSHDSDASGPKMSKALKIAEPIIVHCWHRFTWAYKDGLPHLQGKGVGKGPIIARGASHMVHWDAPELVARELLEILEASSKVISSRL